MHGPRPPRFTPVLALLLLAAVPRLLYVVFSPATLGTGGEMERGAVNLTTRGALVDVLAMDTGPSAHLAPLYPLWLSVLYRLFGVPSVAGRWPQQVCAILAVAAAVALLPWLARRLRLAPWTGWVAALVFALVPLNLWVECSGNWEQPHLPLLIVAMLLTFATLHEDSWQTHRQLVLAGSLVGGAALLSPSVLPAAALMIAAQWYAHRHRLAPVARGTAMLLAVAGLWLAPWIWRNYVELGTPVVLRSNFGLELWVGNNPWANGRSFGTHAEDPNHLLRKLHPYSSCAEQARLRELGELAYMREKKQRALDWIGEHPGRFVALTWRRVQLYWLPTPDLWPPSTPGRVAKAALFTLISVAAVLGLAVLAAGRHPYWPLFLAALVGPSLVYLITHVDARYRYGTFTVSVLLACDAVLRLGQWLSRWRNRRLDQPVFRSTLSPIQ